MTAARNAAARERGRARRIVRVLVALALTGLLVLVAGGLLVQQHLAGNLGRIPAAFTGLTDRPAEPTGAAAGAIDVLLLTADSSSDGVLPGAVAAPDWADGARHLDSVLLVHLDADRRGATVVSLPRSALDAVATPAALVGSVERATDVRIDHLAILDWAAIPALSRRDAGVELPDGEPGTEAAGRRHAYPAEELTGFASGRIVRPGVRLDAVTREQYLLRAVLDRALHQELRREPWALYAVLDTLTEHLDVDSGWSTGDLRGLVWSLRSMRSYEIRYARTAGADDTALWDAVRRDDLRRWHEQHPDQVLPWATG